MQHKYLAECFISFLLIGCTNLTYAQHSPQPPSITQIQGQCFTNFEKFLDQTNCIENIYTNSGFIANSYAQEYLTYMQLLKEKVKHKNLSENNARMQLTSKLSELRAIQENEIAVQEQLANQRAAQTTEILKNYKANTVELPPRITPITPPVIQTNCQKIGGQIHCTSR